MEHQCHCGEAYADDIALKRHIKVVHRNNYWPCSGEWVWDDGTESHCPQVCRDKFSLWKHFQTQHQDQYLHYCLVDSCNWGTDEKTALLQHIQNIHKRKPVADVVSQQIKCPNARSVFHRKTNCGPIYSSVEMRTNLFVVQNVMMLSGIGTVYVLIRSKSTHRGQGIVVLTTNVTFVPKNIHPFHQGGNT